MDGIKIENTKRVFLREKGRSTTMSVDNSMVKGSILLGWFSTSRNVGGWGVYTLSSFDERWMKDEKVNTKNLFRVLSDKGNTSIVKLNLVKGTFAFIDNEVLVSSDVVKFEKMSAYKQFWIDNTNANEIKLFKV